MTILRNAREKEEQMKRPPSARRSKVWTLLFFAGLYLLAFFLFWLVIVQAARSFVRLVEAPSAILSSLPSILAWFIGLGLAVSTALTAVAGSFFVLRPKKYPRVAPLWRILAYVSFVTFALAVLLGVLLLVGQIQTFVSSWASLSGFSIMILVLFFLLTLVYTGAMLWLARICLRGFDASHRSDFRGEMLPRFREIRRSLYMVRRSPLTLAGLILVLAIIATALIVQFAPSLIVPHPEDGGPVYYPQERVRQPPSWAFPFGTDELGRDYLSRILLAVPLDLFIAGLVVGSALVIGIVLGVVAGFFGGWADELIMRVTDVFLSIPGLILAIAFAAALGRGVIYLMGALIIVWWPGYTRLIRGQTLSIRENLYVEAARAVGAKNTRIILRHLLPNTLAPVLVNATLDMGGVILVAAALGYLGLGQPPPLPEWGRLVSDGQAAVLRGEWWLATFPGLAILITSLSFNLVGDGLRDLLDPRLRR